MSLLKYFPETYYDVIREKVDQKLADEKNKDAKKTMIDIITNQYNYWKRNNYLTKVVLL